VFNVDHPVFDLPTTMSKIWHLGVELTDVIAMTTINTARSIHRAHELGTLDVGRTAEISVLRIDDEPAELSDGYETVVADRVLRAVGCVRAGEWIPVAVPAGVGA
jgi:dihydroorotase